MILRTLSCVFVFASLALHAPAADQFKITVTRTDRDARPSETVVVPFSVVRQYLPKTMIDHFVVTAAGSAEPLIYQVTNFEPEEHHDNYRELLFQHDFAAGETKAEFWVKAVDKTVPPFPTHVFARYVPERFDDFAWENDRVGHRAYGQALNTPAAGQSQMISSGIDVWCKRVRYPIVDRWYLKGHYHEDSGEGLDMYDVGRSRGTGGTAVWDGHELHPSGNWKTWRVLANGPIRAVFELGYESWEAAPGVKVSEIKRFTVDAGHNLDSIEDTYTFSGAADLTIAIGITRHERVPAEVAKDPEGRWLTQWETFPKNGSIGEAVVLDPATASAGLAETTADHLVLVKAKSGQAIRYLAGAGWDRSGDFADRKAWDDYVAELRRRQASPLQVSYSAN